MKTFFSDLIPKIERYSKKLDDLTLLTNQHWVSIGDLDQYKRVFIFRSNNQLVISNNGIVEKGTWDYLGNQSLLIDTKEESYLFKHAFFDENVIALKLDSTNSYVFFVNENKYDGEFNDINNILIFLEKKYLQSNAKTRTLNGKKYKYGKYEFEILSEKEHNPLFGGKYIEYQIVFSDDTGGVIFKDITRNYYYFIDWFGDYISNTDFNKTAYEMYLDKKRKSY